MLPLLTIFNESYLYNNPGNVIIPLLHMFVIFGVMTFALAIGFYISRRHSVFYSCFWLYLPICTVSSIISIIGVELYNKAFIFHLITAEIFLFASMTSASGFIIGAAVSYLGRQPLGTLAVITVHTGVRTAYIAGQLTARSLQPPDDDITQTAPTLCALLCLVPCSVVILARRSVLMYKSKQYKTAIDLTDVTSSEDQLDDEETNVDDEDREVFINLTETSM